MDQLDNESLQSLGEVLPNDFDLVIDDGLHAPDANMAVLRLGLKIVKVGGWVVIEDIKPAAAPIWKIVGALIARGIDSHIFQANFELMFAVQRMK